MFVKYFLLLFSVKWGSGCLVSTFHNTSVTLVGVRGVLNRVDGCFGPEKNIGKVSLIQILNETVPVLYEDAFNNLPNLVDIIMDYDGVTEIKPGAFKNLPKLYSIRLKHNNFQEIRDGVFSNLSISELSLINNNIENISPKAFDDMPNLSIILLNNNKIKKWDPNWFRGSPKLAQLDFEYNLITRLPNRAFRNIHGVHIINKLNISTSIQLNNNKINSIDDGAFDGLETLGWLFLQHNQIDNFNIQSLGTLKQLDWLRLDFNNLECVPEKLLEVAPNVKFYLDGNPLSDKCIKKLDIKLKNNGRQISKFNIKIN